MELRSGEGSTRSSFHSTIEVLRGLLEHERAVRASPGLTAARRKAEAYLLDRRMFCRLSLASVLLPTPLRVRRAVRTRPPAQRRRPAGRAGRRGDRSCEEQAVRRRTLALGES